MQFVKNEPVPLKMPKGLSTVTLHVYAFLKPSLEKFIQRIWEVQRDNKG